MSALEKRKITLFCVFVLGYAAFYVYPNFVPLFPPSYMPFMAIDYVTPLLPWTFFIYLSDYLMVPIAVWILKDRDSFNSLARMCFATLFMCGGFFYFFPTIYPRPDYPQTTNVFISTLMYLVRTLDSPTNCFPSNHVALTGVAVWSVRKLKPRTYLLFAGWGLLICLSTLTTKQHYFVDILGGIFVSATVAFLEWAFFSKRILAPILGLAPAKKLAAVASPSVAPSEEPPAKLRK